MIPVLDDGSRFMVRVYFEDTDFSGNVYHAAYLKFFERARTELLRSQGIHHAALARQGLVFAVRELTIAYDRAARIDDKLDVETRVERLSGARLVLAQTISRDGDTICRARVTVVILTLLGRPARLPADLRARFSAL
ncbi:tol-pal system-associated acyl-CoA thioesterase [Pelagibacterium montanilacus]|uniref:tol-pal system-associated acyl-CoA thioesterase n=1 Tax=Pelagibacterium montanilacus TaxID=2185280 RepID=UPI000F8DDC10|nr:tol-pal system-associated acyl-CoA thioesterase [Pelagibacterium montanilacus]